MLVQPSCRMPPSDSRTRISPWLLFRVQDLGRDRSVSVSILAHRERAWNNVNGSKDFHMKSRSEIRIMSHAAFRQSYAHFTCVGRCLSKAHTIVQAFKTCLQTRHPSPNPIPEGSRTRTSPALVFGIHDLGIAVYGLGVGFGGWVLDFEIGVVLGFGGVGLGIWGLGLSIRS